jgi:hypothetical protein
MLSLIRTLTRDHMDNIESNINILLVELDLAALEKDYERVIALGEQIELILSTMDSNTIQIRTIQ